MHFIRILTVVACAIALPLIPVLLVTLPVWFLAPLLGFSWVVSPLLGTIFFLFCPWALFGVFWYSRRWLDSEVRHIADVGKADALWSVSVHHGGSLLVDYVTFQRDSVDTDRIPIAFLPEFWTEMSVTYSEAMIKAHAWAHAPGLSESVAGLSTLLWLWGSFRLLCRAVYWLLLGWFVLLFAIFLSPTWLVSGFLWQVLGLLFLFTPMGWGHLRLRLEWCRLWCVSLLLDGALLVSALNTDIERHYSERLAGRRQRVSAVLRQRIMSTVRFISAVRLPAFVRNRFHSVVGLPELRRGREILAELGWPVNVDIVDQAVGPDVLAGHPEFAEWHVANTDFATGIRQMKLHCSEALQDLAVIAPAYFRTESYRTIQNELESTARYFQDRPVDFDVNVLDDVWHIVKPIYANSRLTKFGDIIWAWEKKYALGFWMTDAAGRRKMSRRSFIAKIGMPAFKQLWARTFVRASEIMPVAHVSVKDEALSPAKYLADRVRSIIGSPISHYIGSTVYSHWANHNFQYESTPIKVGMPLNGFWMGRLFDRHSRFNIHIEGDFTAFDSTVEGPVKDVIRAIRKRGFWAHKDYRGICDLIDVMYDQVDHQFLGHTSTGGVFRKGSGLTTGHSSTSADNSLATVVFYIAAWKKITGLGAREFLHFNELSCYGDDHMLSVQAAAPRSWRASNIARTMAKWGVTNRVQEKKLNDMTFLAKHNSPLNPALVQELKAAGVTGVTRAVWHDKARLVGKLTSKLKSAEPTYRATRLFSYLQLTAHHPEVYTAIVRELKHPVLAAIVKNNWGFVPTYNQVLERWYKPSPTTELPASEDPEDAWANDGRLVVVGSPSLLDHLLQSLAVIPDLLNPALFNFGPSRALIGNLSTHLSWIPTLIMSANQLPAYANLGSVLSRTPYAWCDPDLVPIQRVPSNTTTLLSRHWLFLLYTRLKPRFKGFALGTWALRKTADLAFLSLGQVITDLPRDLFPFDEIFVAAILDWVEIPFDFLEPLKGLQFPDFAALFDVVFNRVLSFVWTSVPANFGEVDPLVAQLSKDEPTLLIKAPTGSGKSTSLVAHFVLSQSAPHRKLIVIEPRSLLAIGLAAHVTNAFGIFSSAATTGSVFDPGARIWFMTPQSFLGHLSQVSKHDLIVIDECHLDEPLYGLLRDQLPKWGFRVVMTSATPSALNYEQCGLHVDIPIAAVFSVNESNHPISGVSDYFSSALAFVNALPKTVKAAVILDTPAQVDQALGRSKYQGQGLSSQHDPNIQDSSRYFCTTVVDVGVTIPGLDVLVSPNWVYAGGGQRYRLTDAVRHQRRGRVGRTNNGHFVLFEAAGENFPSAPESTRMQAWADALSAGISPVLGWHIDPAVMSELFGLEKVSDAQVQDFTRVSHIFLTNFRQMKALELEQTATLNPVGRPAVLVPTGSLGHFSGSVPQDLPEAHSQAMSLLSRLLRAIQAGDSAYSLLKEKLATIRTGPLYRVSNVLLGLSNDPAGWRPELSGSAREATQPDFDQEVVDIISMLREIAEA